VEQCTGQGGQQHWQGREHGSSDTSPVIESSQHGPAQDGQLQALDTLGLMVGCMTALQRMQWLPPQYCASRGEMR
jgi:hypothetical protein